MLHMVTRLALPALLLVLPAVPAAHAAEGFSLAAEVRALLFSGVCDNLPAADIDCTRKPTACFMTRTDGTRFAPMTGWDVAYPFFPLNAWYAFGAPAGASGHPAPPDGSWDPLGQLSGHLTPHPEDDMGVLRLSPEQIAWVLERVVPRPGEIVCGAPAEKLYATFAKPVATTLGEAYLFLNGKKALAKLDREALVTGRHDPKARYEKLCASFVGKRANGGEQYFRRYACEFWLRRAYIDQVEPIARAFASAIEPFDGRLAKRVQKTFPKP